VDRFHVSTIVYQRRVHGREYDFRWLEERLLPLGFRLILCTRSPGSFARAREERLKVSGNPGQYDELAPFIAEQEDMRFEVGRSLLPSFEVDVSDDDVAGAADRIAGWLEASGGLTLAQ
jgi:hypothetical protein